MRDFYRALGLSGPDVQRREIEDALRGVSLDGPTQQAAEHVLLHPERRALYDRHHRVLVQIAQMRANLGLTHTKAWTRCNCHDFEARPWAEPSQVERLKTKLAGATVPSREPVGSGVAGWLWLLGIIAVIGGGIWLANQDAQPTRSTRSKTNSTPRPRPAFNEPVQPLPTTGVVRRSFSGDGVAPLEIVTRAIEGNYYIKIVDWNTKQETATLFVRGGERAKMLLPLGSYELKYAAGQTWYGPRHRFGPDTSYYRADERFDFKRTYQGYSGYTVELYLQLHGNLETERIRPDEF